MSTLPRPRFRLFGRPVSRVLPLLTFVLLPVLAPTVSAQFDVEIGLPIGFHEPYAPESTNDPLPSTTFTSTLANGDDTVLIAQGDFAMSEQIHQEALERIGADLDEVVGVDAGTSGSPMYWLDLFAVDGVPYGGFTTSTAEGPDTVLTLFAGPVTSFADGLAVAQQNVTVDFDLIFPGVEPSGLQALLNAALPQLEGGTGNQALATPEEVAEAATNEFSDMPGMVAEGSYVSPQYGVTLTWTDAWMHDTADGKPVTSDPASGTDRVSLTVNSPLPIWFWLTTVPGPPDYPMENVIDVSTLPSQISQTYGPTAEVVVTRVGFDADQREVGAIIILTTIDGEAFVVHEGYQFSTDHTGIVISQLIMSVNYMDQGFTALEDLSLDGEEVLTLFTPEDIRTIALSEAG